MRSKAPLALMEQMVMLLVFALAAALCLQAFVRSDEISRQSEARDQAAVLCQSAAEIVRYNGGMVEALNRTGPGGLSEVANGTYTSGTGTIRAFFDMDWAPLDAPAQIDDTLWEWPLDEAYILMIEEQPTQVPGLGQARVWVEQYGRKGIGSTECLFELTVSWQEEVTVHG